MLRLQGVVEPLGKNGGEKGGTLKYYLRNKEAIQEQQKQYRKENSEALKERRRNHHIHNKLTKANYYLHNKEAIQLKQKKYRLANKEMIKRVQREYYSKNKDALKGYYLKKREQILKVWHWKKKPRKLKVWKNPSKVREFFEFAGEKLFVRDWKDWYRISQEQIHHIGGGSLYSIFGNLGKALKYAFPGVEWEQAKFSYRGKKSRQRWLRVILEQIVPQNTIILEDFLHPQLFWDETNHRMELDIWVPEYEIGLEYQGEHHYHDLCFAYGPSGTLSLYAQRDQKKKKACAENQITLITIPYWWDGKKESLAATLSNIRPDIFPQTDFQYIPLAPPDSTVRGDLKLKEHKVSSFLMHGEVWDYKEDPTGWLISEKLDGFRAFWDGSKLYSKNGNLLPVPLEFSRYFPEDVCLDGEIWTGYDDFNTLHSIMRKTTQLENIELCELWKDVKFCVFDAPMHPGSYTERHSFASQYIIGPNMSLVPIVTCLGFNHLQTILDQITSKKGEGLMLYHPSTKYTSGRTHHLLKVKASEEEDVKFISKNPNSYSLICEQKNGIECVVKCSGWDYSFPPSPGTVLTVKHNGISEASKKMRYPFLFRVRNHLSWNQIQTSNQRKQ